MGLGVLEHERNADRTGKAFEPWSHINNGVRATSTGFGGVFRGVALERFTYVLDAVHDTVMYTNLLVQLQYLLDWILILLRRMFCQ